MFFKNVTKAYRAEFLQRNPITGAFEYVTNKDGSKIASVQTIAKDDTTKTWFSNPFGTPVYDANGDILSSDITGLYNPKQTNYDFRGWSTDPTSLDPDGTDPTGEHLITTKTEWNTFTLDPNQDTYKFYAIFTITYYTISFYDGDNSLLCDVRYPWGTIGISTPDDKVSWKDDSRLSLTSTYGFEYYSESTTNPKAVDLSKYEVRNNNSLYAIFKEKSVYDNVNLTYFSGINDDGDGVTLSLIK
jgi:hypothetical protein